MNELFLTRIFLFLFTQSLCYGSNVPDKTDGGRIVGGFEISIAQAPYQVALLERGSQYCGGSIISASFVLTACHCTLGVPASYLSVRVGSQIKNAGGEIIAVYSIINHPNFDSYTIDFDFSLLRLRTNIKFDGATKAPIALPAENEAIPDGTQVLISGWGSTKNSNESTSVLRAVILPIINQKVCKNIWKYIGEITDRMVCAGSPGKSSCFGDSGGPMKDMRTNKLIGIVSFAKRCADPLYPGGYSRVASVRSFIKAYAQV